MKSIEFAPQIDLPLIAVILLGFVLSFHFGNEKTDPDSTIDLRARLPKAYFRLFALFGVVMLICWFANLGFYVLLLILLGTGLVGTIVCGDENAMVFFLHLVFGSIREWCLGFPNLILDPESHRTVATPKLIEHPELVGREAITTSQLRPAGEVEIDGREISAVSENGRVIAHGAPVTIVGEQNGSLCVRPIEGPAD